MNQSGPGVVESAKEGNILFVTLNHVRTLNAFDLSMLKAATHVFNRAKEDDSIRVVVLAGAGTRAFCSGGNIAELANLDRHSGMEYAQVGANLLRAIETLGKPVIASIRGYALGGGVELALACTRRIASDMAILGFPEVRLGITTAFGSIPRLIRLCGHANALQLCLLGDRIVASRALSMGLLDEIMPENSLDSHVRDLATRYAELPPCSVRSILQVAVSVDEVNFDQCVQLEAELFSLCCSSGEKRARMSEFLSRRKTQ